MVSIPKEIMSLNANRANEASTLKAVNRRRRDGGGVSIETPVVVFIFFDFVLHKLHLPQAN